MNTNKISSPKAKLKHGISSRVLSVGSIFVILCYIHMIIGCSYYRVNTLDPLSNESIIKQVQKKGKYLILHNAGVVWHLKNVTINEASQKIKGTIEPLPSNHLYYATAKGDKKANRYKTDKVKKSDLPVYEIHIYTSLDPVAPNSEIAIPFTSISKFQVYDNHVGTTITVAAGLVITVVAFVAIIVAATKSSCPFVYIQDNEDYVFAGELFGGAIYSSLERDDYMPLPQFKPTQDHYSIKISNELLERQYTNLANLLVVEHPKNSRVIIDKHGDVQTITNPQLPNRAVSQTNVDYTSHIISKDSTPYLFDALRHEDNNISSLTMSFKRPIDSKSGKLIINAKNSFWLDYVYGKFNEQFGTYFNAFSEEQKKVPAKKNIQWTLDQNIPLSVFVETDKGWEFVDYFNSLGPLATRDLVMPIDLTQVKGENVRIKLQCGFMFWEVDYTAMDFSENISVGISNLIPESAFDEEGTEVSELITSSDKKYLIQREIGNVVTINYLSTMPKDGSLNTIFLHSRGYYEYIREYENWPDVSYLQTFQERGAFTKFSKEQYDVFVNADDLIAAAWTQPNEN